jgi:hypothetical protein
MKNIKIISFYSDLPGLNYYTEAYNNFLLCCKNNNLDPYIEQLNSSQNYRLNCLKKPKFILDTILKLKQPVMWIDIDSTIHTSMPELLKSEEQYDIGLCFPGYGSNINLNRPPKASPIIFNYNQKGVAVLSRWVEECEKNISGGGNFFDHEVFVDYVLPILNANALKIFTLDEQYCTTQNTNPNFYRHITMGIAKHEHKKQGLRDMGMTEHRIKAETGE